MTERDIIRNSFPPCFVIYCSNSLTITCPAGICIICDVGTAVLVGVMTELPELTQMSIKSKTTIFELSDMIQHWLEQNQSLGLQQFLVYQG